MPSGIYETLTGTRTVRVDTDLSAAENHLVTLDGTDDLVVNLAAGATAPMFVLMEGKDGSVTEDVSSIPLIGSIVRVKTAGNVTAGARLTSNGSGRAIATTTNRDHYAGIALENGSSGDEVLMVVSPGMVSAA
jgi:hypothetical protein